MTRLAPAVRCAAALSRAVKMPVHSSAMSTPSSFHGSCVGILDRGDLELLLADGDGVALDLDLMREAAVHAVVAQQMRIGLDRAEIVDGDHVDVLAARFVDGAQDVAADAAKSVDGNSDGHFDISLEARGDMGARLLHSGGRPRNPAARLRFKSISMRHATARDDVTGPTPAQSIGQPGFGRVGRRLGSDAEMRVELLGRGRWRRSRVMPMNTPSRADEAGPSPAGRRPRWRP